MREPTDEKRGDVILGEHLVRCHHDTAISTRGGLRLVRSPLYAGPGGTVEYDEHQTAPGGWSREVKHELDTTADDPTRATSRFEVLSVVDVPPSDPGFGSRDAGYGGGIRVTVKRLDGKPERIVYTRRCTFNTDVHLPAKVVSP